MGLSSLPVAVKYGAQQGRWALHLLKAATTETAWWSWDPRLGGAGASPATPVWAQYSLSGSLGPGLTHFEPSHIIGTERACRVHGGGSAERSPLFLSGPVLSAVIKRCAGPRAGRPLGSAFLSIPDKRAFWVISQRENQLWDRACSLLVHLEHSQCSISSCQPPASW